MSGCISALHRAQHGCYAHFPGSGPADRTCRECSWCEMHGAKPYCNKFAELARIKAHRPGKGCIDGFTAACRYFQEQ